MKKIFILLVIAGVLCLAAFASFQLMTNVQKQELSARIKADMIFLTRHLQMDRQAGGVIYAINNTSPYEKDNFTKSCPEPSKGGTKVKQVSGTCIPKCSSLIEGQDGISDGCGWYCPVFGASSIWLPWWVSGRWPINKWTNCVNRQQTVTVYDQYLLGNKESIINSCLPLPDYSTHLPPPPYAILSYRSESGATASAINNSISVADSPNFQEATLDFVASGEGPCFISSSNPINYAATSDGTFPPYTFQKASAAVKTLKIGNPVLYVGWNMGWKPKSNQSLYQVSKYDSDTITVSCANVSASITIVAVRPKPKNSKSPSVALAYTSSDGKVTLAVDGATNVELNNIYERGQIFYASANSPGCHLKFTYDNAFDPWPGEVLYMEQIGDVHPFIIPDSGLRDTYDYHSDSTFAVICDDYSGHPNQGSAASASITFSYKPISCSANSNFISPK